MAPITAATRGGGAVTSQTDKSDWRNIPEAKRTLLLQSNSTRVDNESKLQLAKPLTRKARHRITRKTTILIKKRDDIDSALVAESQPKVDSLSAEDWLPREGLLGKNEALARCERRHIQILNKAIQERQSLYRRDPSTERATDLDLIRTLHWKFKRHLGPYLQDRLGEKDNDSMSSGPQMDDDDDGRAPVAYATDSDSSDDHDSSEDTKPEAGLDGSFDDHVRAQPKKRKLGDGTCALESEKEQRKKAKKEKRDKKKREEQAGRDNHQTAPTTLESQFDTPRASILSSTDKGADVSSKFLTDGGPAPKPWYKIHAMAMMDPGFNDHVHESQRRSRGPPRNYFVSGALPAPPRDVVLPTPPGSSSSSTGTMEKIIERPSYSNPKFKRGES